MTFITVFICSFPLRKDLFWLTALEGFIQRGGERMAQFTSCRRETKGMLAAIWLSLSPPPCWPAATGNKVSLTMTKPPTEQREAARS